MPEWEVMPLGELCDELTVGHVGSMASEYVISGIPFLRSQNVKRGYLDLNGLKYISSEFHQKLKKSRLLPGNIVIVRTGEPGAAALIPDDLGELNCSDLVIARPGKNVDSRFLCYSINSTAERYISAHLVGAVQQHFNVGSARNLHVSLPPFSEQQAIAAVLGSLDDKIAINDRIAGKSRELITLKYRESIAFGVTSVGIGEIAELFDGPHATPKKAESGPWFLSISSLNSGRLLLDESAHLSEDDFAQWTRRVTPKPGDVLFSYETRLGDAALMPAGIRACLGRRMALLRPRDIGSRTLLQAFLAPSFQDTIRQYAVHGATVDRIPLTEFPSWRIELPAQASHQLESVFARLDNLAQELERENETLAVLRDTLLPKLMTGEIRVRGAEKIVEDVT
jgi:type I restriction enzyme S subunit